MNFRWFFVYFFVCFIAHLLSFYLFFFILISFPVSSKIIILPKTVASSKAAVSVPDPTSFTPAPALDPAPSPFLITVSSPAYVYTALVMSYLPPPRRRSSLCRSWKLCLPHPYPVAGRLHTTPKAPGADAADCHHCFQVRGAIGGGGGWLTPACWRHISWENEAVNLFIVEPPKKVNTIKVKLIVFGVIFLWLN